jgi:hypothetical protein
MDGDGLTKNLSQFVARSPFGADIRDPLKVIVATVVFVHCKAWALLFAVNDPVIDTEPVLAFNTPAPIFEITFAFKTIDPVDELFTP